MSASIDSSCIFSIILLLEVDNYLWWKILRKLNNYTLKLGLTLSLLIMLISFWPYQKSVVKMVILKNKAKHCNINVNSNGDLNKIYRWKRLVFILILKKGNTKECSNYHTVVLISHASKVMLKVLQARLQWYVNQGLPDVQVGYRKAEEPEIKFPTFLGSQKKQRNSRKTPTSASPTMLKPLPV